VQPFSGWMKCLASVFLLLLLAISEPIRAQTSSSKTASGSHKPATPADLPQIDQGGYNRHLEK
jgi:hypothetical protein